MTKRFVVGASCLAALVAVGVWFLMIRVSKEATGPESVLVHKEEGSQEDQYNLVSSADASWDDSPADGPGGSGNSGLLFSDSGKKEGAALEARKASVINRLVSASGVERRLSNMNHMVEQQLESLVSDQDMTEKERADFAKLIRDHFDGQAMLEQYKKELAVQLSEAELGELRAVYNDPLVLRYQQINNDLLLNLTEQQDDFADYQSQQSQNPSPEERASLIARLDEVTGASAQTARLSMEVLNAFFQDDGSPEGKEVEAEFREDFSRSVAKQVRLGIEYAVRDYQDAEVEDTIRAHDKALIRKTAGILTDVVRNPMIKVLQAAKLLSESRNSGGPVN